jgi:hypothetical protein
MLIRRARNEDAVQACEVMRRSIAELCRSDHHDDPEILRRWLGNKTPAVVGSWIADLDKVVLVAVEDDLVLAVGAVKSHGEITSTTSRPMRGSGASAALCWRSWMPPHASSVTTPAT